MFGMTANPVILRDSLADSILILLVLLKAITRVLSKDESISHLHLYWKCLILHWLLASIYKEGSRLGKLLELSFNGYSQPALCHYWPAFDWASTQICDIIRPLSALLHTLHAPYITPLNHTLFSTRLIARGLTLDSTIPLFSSPIQIPTLNSKRDFRASQGWAARKLTEEVGRGAFGCFT